MAALPADGPCGEGAVHARRPPAAPRHGRAEVPTAAHAMVAALLEEGLLAHVVSQNVDNLHRRSGVPGDAGLSGAASASVASTPPSSSKNAVPPASTSSSSSSSLVVANKLNTS